MKFSIEDFFNKCDQICQKLRIWSHLLKEPAMENFNFYIALAAQQKWNLQIQLRASLENLNKR